MGEYDKEKFSDELNGKETRLIGKEEMDELKLENEFEPLDKDLDFDKELGDVAKFIDTIKPKKWEYRSETLALTLISLEDPQKRKEIEKELYKVYPDKRVHYTNEYKNLLKNLCEKQGYDLNSESLIKAIENALINKSKREINIYGKNVIKNFKKKLEKSY